ncbi:hypothetical protein BCR24_15535 [Enterococcus ureilyticus]|uniref:Uncharacterized protein n=1 Tax=Enterococcus ureilyticus TaxID=1131292 RepID=A0A1E5HCP1_9ENTE|nr:hypothetical protein [Enterococcus ureilyticus]MBM7690198.1 hypothetical protein [Enterococcus ureilyticus]OEG22430.1 hypothetical protein BCR24_15535 [Enterococcus ureilyticus]
MEWFIVNIWENDYLVNWLTAIGTIGAVWVSLWLARSRPDNSKLTGMVFDYDIYTSKSSITKQGGKIVEEKDISNFEGFMQLYNPSEFNRYLYDLRICAHFLVNGKIHKMYSDMYDVNYKKINHVKLIPKDAVVAELRISFFRYKDEENEFNIEKLVVEGKNEKQQNMDIVIYQKN